MAKSKAQIALEHTVANPITAKRLQKRFDSFVDKSDQNGCWVWTGTHHERGYGHFKANGHQMRAHRISYTIKNGEIPDGLVICHTCNNPPCVNPDHLYAGTMKDNAKDRDDGGRANSRKGSNHGNAVLNEEIVRMIRANKSTKTVVLARKFGVNRHTISGIKTGKTWKHV